jgi:hypothetical protein
LEGRIETTIFKKFFVFWQLVGLDTAAVIEWACKDVSESAAYSTISGWLKFGGTTLTRN